MPNRRYQGHDSPITGKYFLVLGRDPVALRVGGDLCVPVFSGQGPITEAERSFQLPHGKVRKITDGDRFYNIYHHNFRIILDPRVVDGQPRYDEIEVDPDPKEVS